VRSPLPNLQDPQGRLYEFEELPIHASIGSKAFRVYRPDGLEFHDVHRTRFGTVECSCGDYQCRKKGTTLLCKHGASLVDAGLMPRPTY
jgi:hypothetical protein